VSVTALVDVTDPTPNPSPTKGGVFWFCLMYQPAPWHSPPLPFEHYFYKKHIFLLKNMRTIRIFMYLCSRILVFVISEMPMDVSMNLSE
jgi:hypothetical protein